MIDPKLQAELRAKYNPDGSDLRKMQLRMLEMLQYIDKICRENGLKYWLSSGTCLGAVRHEGFIPWDDDCDVEMLAEDYKKFIKILKQADPSIYDIQDNSTDPNYKIRYAKLRDRHTFIQETHHQDDNYKFRGVFIDIFPMYKSNSVFIHKAAKVIYKNYISNEPRSKFIRFFSSNLISFVFYILQIISSIGKPKRLRHRIGVVFNIERFYKDIFPLKRCKFENTEFNVPCNTDSYLTTIYGSDYMTLPSMDDIELHTTMMKEL